MEESQEASLPLKQGMFRVRAFRDMNGFEHLAVYMGDIKTTEVPLRIHSQCTTGDIFHSLKCDCGQQLEESLKIIAENKRGIILYMAQEGRGIGLLNKINAYRLQEQGLDTVDANLRLGFDSDLRQYRDAALILRQLQVKSVKLITNNPSKISGLTGEGIPVSGRIPIIIPANCHNQRYLDTKKNRMDQLL
jgi:3,4-dihydroxy 2-butanone 4-phosphate synthase / GTP cyclohydrolase II